MNKKSTFPLIFSILFSLSACNSTAFAESADTSGETVQTESTDSASAVSTTDMFTDRDLEIGYDEETSTKITLSGDSASSDSDAVQISGSTVTITDEGTYILSGTLDDGMIIINAEDTDKIQLVLDGVQITSSTSAAIYVLEADKVFVTTASDSENTLSNGGEYVAIDDNNIDAVIFSKADLTLNGAGTLTINTAAGHGIVSKDDLVFTSGTYHITAADHGISGKDSVRIADGTFSIVSGKDGIHAENTDDSSLGFLYVASGTFEITAEGDGMSAGAYLQIEDGTFNVVTGEGSSSVTMTTDTTNFAQRGMFHTKADTTETTTTTETTSITETEESVSQKGIKSDGDITIANGSFVTDTVDDAFHAGGNIFITTGEYNLKSGDDAIHSDAAITIQDGNFNISYCYEGIEGMSITINGGTYDIASNDDGLNAAGGTDSSGLSNGSPQQDHFSTNSDSFITINDGSLTIVSNGDCVDSNGDLTINGGTLNLNCTGSGNTALDTDGTYTNNGGDITTNDNSESQTNFPGGGKSRGSRVAP